MIRRLPIVVGLLLAASATTPARASHLTTYWWPHDTIDSRTITVGYGDDIVTQYLYPLRVAVLKADAILPHKGRIVAGTVLYQSNGPDNQIVFCPAKDRSRAAATLFMPVLDTRACLIDAEHDGQFKAAFSVFDIWQAPPTPRGDLESAEPIQPVAYSTIARTDYPNPIIMTMILHGGGADLEQLRSGLGLRDLMKGWDPERPSVEVKFEGGSKRRLKFATGQDTDRGYQIDVLNLRVLVLESGDREARIEISSDPRLAIIGLNNASAAVPIPAATLQ